MIIAKSGPWVDFNLVLLQPSNLRSFCTNWCDHVIILTVYFNLFSENYQITKFIVVILMGGGLAIELPCRTKAWREKVWGILPNCQTFCNSTNIISTLAFSPNFILPN